MQLELLSVTLWDFKEYRGKHHLCLADLGYGLHFVCGQNLVDKGLGSNGASKSTIFDAITWCLYGVTIKGLKGPDVRTWGGDKHATVKMWLHVDGANHSIKRSTKTNGLELDGKQTTQDAIDRLLRLPFALWGHTVLLGQGEDLFLDLKPTAKMNVLSEALSLDKWDERSKRAKERADRYAQTERDLEQSFCNLKEALEKLNDDFGDIRARSDVWEQEQSTLVDRRNKEISRLTKECDRVDRERGAFDLAYDSAETELRAARKLQAEIKSEVQDASAAYSGTTERANALRAQIEEHEEALANAASESICPTCGQEIKGRASREKHEATTKAKIAALKGKLREAKAAHALAEKAWVVQRDRVNKLRTAVDLFFDKSNSAQDGLTRATRQLADLKGELKALRTQEQDQSENPFDEMRAKVRKQIKETKSLIAENEKLRVITGRKRARAQYWIKGFKQVRLYLLAEALDELEAVTATMLSAVGLDAWAIRYEIERETKTGSISSGLSVAILKPTMSKVVKWESWSGGEAQRLRLIASMALSEMLLRRAGIECDTMILDEPTQHLSPEGVRDTVDLLLDRAKDMQLFYIDHTAQQSKRFASTIMVTKRESGASFNVT